MRKFTFAALLGSNRADILPDEPDPKSMDDEDIAAPEDDVAAPGEDDADGVAPEDDEDGGADEVTAAGRRAFRRGVAAERARVCGILDRATPGTVAMAATAIAAGVTATQARAIMAAAPAPAGRLAAEMRGRSPAPLSVVAADGDDGPQAIAARILAHAGRTRQER